MEYSSDILGLPLTSLLQVECDRLDIMHKFFLVARQFEDPSFGGLYTYQLPDRPRVLDLGCGTGIWAIDTAELVQLVSYFDLILTYIQSLCWARQY
jgi:SAM-dependent methyltransferase